MTRKTKVRMTVAEFLAIPDDGVDRWLVNGEIWEFGTEHPGLTIRNPPHSRATARIGQLLGNWVDSQPPPRGDVVGGEAGFHLPGEAATVVGLDVAYIDAALATQPSEGTLFEGGPALAVEVLSPHDTMGFISDRIKVLLSAGVRVVWIVDPYDQTVCVRRKAVPPQFFDSSEELSGESVLPGFRVPVAQLFA